MKIILTSNTSWNLAHFRAGLIKALISDGHEVVALAPSDRGIPELHAMGVRFEPMDMDNKGLSPIRDGRLIKTLREKFKQEMPDAVFSFTIKNNIYGAIAASTQKILFVPNVSGLGTAFLGSGILRTLVTVLYRKAFRSLPTVFFQNSDDAELFVDDTIVTPKQVAVLPGSGIDLAQFTPAPLPSNSDGAVIFLLIARMLRDKGVHEYVAAAKMLRHDNPSLRFQLLGDVSAPNRTAIDADTMAEWVDEGHIEYLGAVDDVRACIAAADCIVLPSYREGTPRTLLEGAAMGRPLIATDVPGCREVVDHDTNGYLCSVRDSAALAEAMKLMVQTGSRKRAEMGKAGRRLVERRFDENIVIARYREVLDGCFRKQVFTGSEGQLD